MKFLKLFLICMFKEPNLAEKVHILCLYIPGEGVTAVTRVLKGISGALFQNYYQNVEPEHNISERSLLVK